MKTTTKKSIPTEFETWCPLFPGFYNTVFEADEESEIYCYNQEYGTNYDYNNFTWDYKDYETRVGKAFVNRLERELQIFLPSLSIEFQAIESPKEYNFRNDSIDVKINVDLIALIKLLRHKDRLFKAEKYVQKKYTSRSGFISFHSNHIGDWLNIDYILQDKTFRTGALLELLAVCEIDEDEVVYFTDDEDNINFNLKDNEQ